MLNVWNSQSHSDTDIVVILQETQLKHPITFGLDEIVSGIKISGEDPSCKVVYITTC